MSRLIPNLFFSFYFSSFTFLVYTDLFDCCKISFGSCRSSCENVSYFCKIPFPQMNVLHNCGVRAREQSRLSFHISRTISCSFFHHFYRKEKKKKWRNSNQNINISKVKRRQSYRRIHYIRFMFTTVCYEANPYCWYVCLCRVRWCIEQSIKSFKNIAYRHIYGKCSFCEKENRFWKNLSFGIR